MLRLGPDVELRVRVADRADGDRVVFLVTLRRDQLRTEANLDSLFCRESMFLLQNIVLVALTLVIAWLTLFR